MKQETSTHDSIIPNSDLWFGMDPGGIEVKKFGRRLTAQGPLGKAWVAGIRVWEVGRSF
jgi:hypothetical protein